MHGLQQPFGSVSAPHGDGQPPPPQQQIYPIPNVFENPNLFLQQQVANILPLFNPFFANPNIVLQLLQMVSNFHYPVQMIPNNDYFQTLLTNGSMRREFPQNHVTARDDMVEKVEKAVKTAWAELLVSNENVSGWKVSQAALLMLKVESWENLGFQMQQVPSLSQLFATEGKINSFINCFVAVRRITTLHDLEVAICESEGIERFEELELGPMARHPLVVHYFSLSSNATEVHRIKTEEIISYLYEFIRTHKNRELEVDTFLNFITKEKLATNTGKLCIRIQNFRSYVNHIKQVMQSEDRLLEESSEKIRRKYHRSKSQTHFSESKNEIDDHLSSISKRTKSFSSAHAQYCGKHIRFASSSSEDDDSEGKINPDMSDADRNRSMPVPNIDVSSCSHPSATEITRIKLKKADSSTYFPSGGINRSVDNGHSKRKRGSTSNLSHKQLELEKHKAGHKRKRVHDGFTKSESLQIFIRTWREACKTNSAEQVFVEMLEFYKTKKKIKRKALEMFSSYPFVGLLYAAVSCIKFGMSDANSQTLSQQDMDEKSLVSLDNLNISGGEPATKTAVISAPRNLKQKLSAEANPTHAASFPGSEIPESSSKIIGNVIASRMNAVLDSVDLVAPDSMNSDSKYSEINQVILQQPLLTGKLGEIVAYDYFMREEDEASVQWVNEADETGLPYDIIIADNNRTEYIEVKATKSDSKMWFFISTTEWEYAIEKAESFSIAHVVLANNNVAKITIYKNPAALWRLGKMKLAALPANYHQGTANA